MKGMVDNMKLNKSILFMYIANCLKGKAGFFINFVNLQDSVDVSSESEGDIKFLGSGDGFFDGSAHNFFKTGVNDIEFRSTSEQFSIFSVKLDFCASLISDDLQEVLLGFFFPSLDESTGSHMVEVLQPFEVRDGNTTSVQQDIGEDEDTSLGEDIFSSEGSGSVSSFSQNLALELASVKLVDGLFDGSRDGEIARLVESAIILIALTTGEVEEGSLGSSEFEELIGVDTIRVVDGSFNIDNTDQFGTLFSHELTGEVTDVTETLNDDGLSFVTVGAVNSVLLHQFNILQEFSDTEEDTETSRFDSTFNTTLTQRFTGDTSGSVDIVVAVEDGVSILHPGHFSGTSTHIRSGDIDGSTNEVLSGQFQSVSSGQIFEFSGRVLAGVDLDTTLTTTVGEFDDGALQGHQAGEGFDFLKIDVFRVSGTTLNWESVMLVLGSVSGDEFHLTVVSNEGKTNLEDSRALLVDFQLILGDVGEGTSDVEVLVDHF